MFFYIYLCFFVLIASFSTFSYAGQLILTNPDGSPTTTLPSQTISLQLLEGVANPVTTAAGVIQVNAPRYEVRETGLAVTVVVQRSGGVGRVTVDYLTVDGTATANSDYLPARGVLSWENGDTSPRILLIGIIDDNTLETAELFTFCLTHPTGGAVIGRDNAIVSIADNEVAGRLPPIAAFTLSQSAGLKPLGIVANAEKSTVAEKMLTDKEENALVRYSWRTTDGQQAEGKIANFTFNRLGKHTVILTVTDKLGATAVQAREVTVWETMPFCDGQSCVYRVPLDRAGFYVATTRLDTVAKAGFWGLTVETATTLNIGGFNAGSVLHKPFITPAFIAFYLAKPEKLRIIPYEYTGTEQKLRVELRKQDLQTGQRDLVHEFKAVSTATAILTSELGVGFYVLETYGEANTARGQAGISINANDLSGSINVGGWLDAVNQAEGFGAFYVDAPQEATLRVFYGDTFGIDGAGQVYLDIYYQEPDGTRTLYWTALSP